MIELDHRLFFLVFGAADGAFAPLMRSATFVGGGFGLFGLAPLLFHPEGRRLARAVVTAVATQVVVVWLLKQLVGRVRPWQLFDLAVLHGPTDASFPSGHAAGSFATAVVCMVWLHRRRKRSGASYAAALFLTAFAVLVATSRVYLGVHFPSDVVAGGLIGSGIGLAVALVAFPRDDEAVGDPIDNSCSPGQPRSD